MPPRDAEALGPDAFRAVQRPRLPGGETPTTFCEWVKPLLDVPALETRRPRPAPRDEGVASSTTLTVGRRVPAAVGSPVMFTGGFALGLIGWRNDPPSSQAGAGTRPPTPQAQTQGSSPSDQPQVDPQSVAVLAFANLSAERDPAYFSDGISAEILTTLDRIPALRVTPRTSSVSFKGKHVARDEIGRAPRGARVIEGRVRKADTQRGATARRGEIPAVGEGSRSPCRRAAAAQKKGAGKTLNAQLLPLNAQATERGAGADGSENLSVEGSALSAERSVPAHGRSPLLPTFMKSRLALLGLLVVTTLPGQTPPPASATPPPRPPPRQQTMRPEIVGQRGIVAAGRHYSVSAGTRILEQGGNAIDAGVATVFAAAVVEISHFGFGGESPVMVYDAKTKQVYVINGQGPAPKAATPALFAAKGKIDGNGPLGATIPAVMDAMALVLERFGTLTLAQVMAPAIAFADGFPMYALLRENMAGNRKQTEAYTWGHLYYAGGRLADVGEIFRQPNLAATLRTIVAAERDALEQNSDRRAAIRAGRDAFYQGEIARRIVEANRAEGGVFTYADLANYHGAVEAPVTTLFHGYEINKAGAWNQGPGMLMALNILEGCDLQAMGLHSTDYIHTVHEALKLAYDDRNAFLGDPAFAQVPMKGLLSKAYAAERRKLIAPQASLEHRPGDPYAFDPDVKPPAVRYLPHTQGTKNPDSGGDTTCVTTVDAAGNLFSATPSSGWVIGGAFIAGDTGVPLSNRMQAFDLDPASPNLLVGGKRPRTTLSPTIVRKDGQPFLAMSTPGGDSQDQQVLNVLLNLILFQQELQIAIESPRINSNHAHSSFDNHPNAPGQLEIESRIPPTVLDELRARGHVLRVLPPYGMNSGVVAVGVNQATGTLRGGSDLRRERYIFGW